VELTFSILAVVATTGLIVAAHLLLALRCGADRVAELVIVTGTFACAQIVMSEIILGSMGALYPGLLTILNSVVALAIIAASSRNPSTPRSLLRRGARRITVVAGTIRDVTSWHHAALAFLALCTLLWVAAAVACLPPRGVDDLTYHLPPVFEYIATHRITLLPVELRLQFAYPQNAELLFLWPTIFLHSQQFVDGANIVFLLFSLVIVYGLARETGRRVEEALFIALLFFFTPVLLIQSGSNYIDLIVATFFLAALYCTLRFLRTAHPLSAHGAATAIGLACGMKYTMPFLLLPLFLVMLPPLSRLPKRHLAAVAASILSLGGWWYLRNALQLGNPLYPMNFHADGMGFMAGKGEFNLLGSLFNGKKWAWLYLRDIGIGTHDGGFGLLFWGFGTISLIVVVTRSLLSRPGTEKRMLLIWLQTIPMIAILLLVPENEFPFAPRFSVPAVAIGLLAFGELLSLITATRHRALLHLACTIFALHSVILLADAKSPTYRLDRVFSDRRHGIESSEFAYYQDSYAALGRWSHAWEPLDLLTRNAREGAACYIAAPKGLFLTAPLYGTRLQNRVWNFDPAPARSPDAFVYYQGGNGEVSYLGSKVTLDEVVAHPGYLLVSQSPEPGAFLFVNRSLLQDRRAHDDLAAFYQRGWPDGIAAARVVPSCLEDGLPVIASGSAGYGLMAQKLSGKLHNDVILAPPGWERRVAEARNFSACYSIAAPLAGYDARALPCPGIRIFKNTRKTKRYGEI